MLIENSAAESRHPYDRLLSQRLVQLGITTNGVGTYTILNEAVTPNVRTVITSIRILAQTLSRLSSGVGCLYRVTQGPNTLYYQPVTHPTYAQLYLVNDQPIIAPNASNILLLLNQQSGGTFLAVDASITIDEYLPT